MEAAVNDDKLGDRPQPAQEEIAARAYELYCDQGCEDGHDVEQWLQAEDELTKQSPESHSSPNEGADR